MTLINEFFDDLTGEVDIESATESSVESENFLQSLAEDSLEEQLGLESILQSMDKEFQTIRELNLMREKLTHQKAINQEDRISLEHFGIEGLPSVREYTKEYSRTNYQISLEKTHTGVIGVLIKIKNIIFSIIRSIVKTIAKINHAVVKFIVGERKYKDKRVIELENARVAVKAKVKEITKVANSKHEGKAEDVPGYSKGEVSESSEEWLMRTNSNAFRNFVAGAIKRDYGSLEVLQETGNIDRDSVERLIKEIREKEFNKIKNDTIWDMVTHPEDWKTLTKIIKSDTETARVLNIKTKQYNDMSPESENLPTDLVNRIFDLNDIYRKVAFRGQIQNMRDAEILNHIHGKLRDGKEIDISDKDFYEGIINTKVFNIISLELDDRALNKIFHMVDDLKMKNIDKANSVSEGYKKLAQNLSEDWAYFRSLNSLYVTLSSRAYNLDKRITIYNETVSFIEDVYKAFFNR